MKPTHTFGATLRAWTSACPRPVPGASLLRPRRTATAARIAITGRILARVRTGELIERRVLGRETAFEAVPTPRASLPGSRCTHAIASQPGDEARVHEASLCPDHLERSRAMGNGSHHGDHVGDFAIPHSLNAVRGHERQRGRRCASPRGSAEPSLECTGANPSERNGHRPTIATNHRHG